MNTCPVAMLAGLVLLAAAGTAMAHEEPRYVVRAADLGGSVSVWSGSQGTTGWAGTLNFGAPAVVGVPVLPTAAVPAPHWHEPRCRHAHQAVVYEYGRPILVGYSKGPKHRPGRGRGHGRHH